jgi:hypothetical protein
VARYFGFSPHELRRVQRPEHFGIASVDCAKARFKWMLCDFYGKILIPLTIVDHNRVELDRALAQLKAAREEHDVREKSVSASELSNACSGSTTKLRDHVTTMLAGRETIITALEYRVFVRLPGHPGLVERKREHWDTNEAVCARRLMRGHGWTVCRTKASLKMPNTVAEVIRDTNLIIGVGPGSPDDVPALVKSLTHEDTRIRIEAAEDLGLIGLPAAVTGDSFQRYKCDHCAG